MFTKKQTRSVKFLGLMGLGALLLSAGPLTQYTHTDPEPNPVVVFHPVFQQTFSCLEHYGGQLSGPGDALGTDCVIQKLTTEKGRTWARAYKKRGHRNADWYGWRQNVLAPFEGQVIRVNINPVVNRPGKLGKGIASYILIKRQDGMMAILAHVREVQVKTGEQVKTGQILAKVGNNAQSRHPHIHLGAWKDQQAYQIRFDQRFMKPVEPSP